jgi:Holliday junction resolvasome RuvABC endonuclease subunit
MKIAGLDLSPNGTGIVKIELDDKLQVINSDYIGFKQMAKTDKTTYENVFGYRDMKIYDKIDFMYPKIFEFLEGVEYAAVEGYAFAGQGDLTMIAEFAGGIKNHLYHKNVKMRLVDPNSNKFLATGSGSAKKPEMYDSFITCTFDGKPDISKLPQIPVFKKGKNEGKRDEKGVTPTSDIIDAYFLAYTLLTELRLRRGLVTMSDLNENQIKVFNRVTKAYPENILVRDFLFKK